MKKPKMKGVYLKKGYWYARIDGKPFEDPPPFANQVPSERVDKNLYRKTMNDKSLGKGGAL